MNIRSAILALAISLMPFPLRASELKPETLRAWDEYIQAVNSRMRARVNQEGHFLRVEETPDRVASVIGGQILVEPVAKDGHQTVPHGLIHDWYGAVFVPGATLEDALSVLSDYDRYREFFHPTVVNSKLLERTSENDRFSMLMVSKVLFVTAAIAAQYESRLTCPRQKLEDRLDSQPGQRRCYIVSSSVRTQQVKDYGRSAEHTLPPDEGDGYLWRLYAITMFEELEGGVLIENESIGLSRDIPVSVRWLVNPIVNHLPRNSLSTALKQTRDAVSSAAALESRQNDIGHAGAAGYAQVRAVPRFAVR
jgi:hypothetical protein